ncbi:MAG: hypothetical protein EP298_05545 [Gammaproteobacteria bacterium]|nr:MAG: hypothetical protein EP298_05545 [Gammaproteobacteria bacterium]UTW42738.1 hypothetical protein KFE69_00910 [bacterium SCSIO 12844]
MTKIIKAILCTMFSLLFINTLYAQSNYTMYITNYLKQSITISHDYDNCINSGADSGMHSFTIDPNQTKSFAFADKNSGLHCYNKNKRFQLKIATTGSCNHSMIIKWNHDGSWQHGWHTEMSTQSGDSQHGMSMLSATCNDSNCLNTEYNSGSDFNINVTIGIDPSIITGLSSYGLGDPYAETIAGDLIKKNCITDAQEVNLSNGKYAVYFTSTTNRCSINNGEIQCPSSIGYVKYNQKLTFVCLHGQSNDPACPWIIKNSGSDDDSSPVNDY